MYSCTDVKRMFGVVVIIAKVDVSAREPKVRDLGRQKAADRSRVIYGVQIVDVCVSTHEQNGGLIETSKLIRLVSKLRGVADRRRRGEEDGAERAAGAGRRPGSGACCCAGGWQSRL